MSIEKLEWRRCLVGNIIDKLNTTEMNKERITGKIK